jgi:hypothetical protein
MRTPARCQAVLGIAALVAIVSVTSSQAPVSAQDATPDFRTGADRKMIHIVPPVRGYLQPFSGRVEIQTLIIHPLITAVDFFLDGERAWRTSKRPYIGHVELTAPARKQTLEVCGYGSLGEVAGTVRLACELTDYKRLLLSRVRSLMPRLGTALNDAILFSLLQYGGEPGRRALVVVTDGYDQHSRSEREQSAEFADRLGVPIYFIQLDQSSRKVFWGSGTRGRTYLNISRTAEQRRSRKRLERISQRTGGRLFTIELHTSNAPLTERLQRVFDVIQDDLSHQYVLTHYTEQRQDAAVDREVRLTRGGLRLRNVVSLDAIE